MQLSDVHKLLVSFNQPYASVVETHISWVILTDKYAYKIKRPVRYSFLDFSTLELRHHYCEREIELNRRLTSDVYLRVCPIYKNEHLINFESGEIVDYAIQMRRLPGSRQMDHLLQHGGVTYEHMEQIANQLAVFHRSTAKAVEVPDIKRMHQDLADLIQHIPLLQQSFTEAERILPAAMNFAKSFLEMHERRIHERYEQGFVIDGHGDLHAKNIFLLHEPVIFDCIEFNDHLRLVDVLDELAFFCNDLALYQREDLLQYFLDCYFALHKCRITSEDEVLFNYFRLYRSAVKMKINLIKADSAKDDTERKARLARGGQYFDLFMECLGMLKMKDVASGFRRTEHG